MSRAKQAKQAKPETRQTLLNQSEVAKRFGVHPSTVARWASKSPLYRPCAALPSTRDQAKARNVYYHAVQIKLWLDVAMDWKKIEQAELEWRLFMAKGAAS